MKMIVSCVIVSIGLMVAPSMANAQEALAKSSGCLNCHAVNAKKVGPAFKEIAAKYQGNADAEAHAHDKALPGQRDIPRQGEWRTM